MVSAARLGVSYALTDLVKSRDLLANFVGLWGVFSILTL